MDEKREKNRSKNESLRNSSSTDTKGATCLILKNHASGPVRKKRLSPASETKMEASRNKFVKKSGVPDGVESFREVDSSENRPRARLGFVKPNRDGMRKLRNLIESILH